MSRELHAHMLADIMDAVFGNNSSAAPADMRDARDYFVIAPNSTRRNDSETWLAFAYRLMKLDQREEDMERWESFLAYLKSAGKQYSVGYQAGYTAGAAKARQDMTEAIQSLAACHSEIGSLLVDLKKVGPKGD